MLNGQSLAHPTEDGKYWKKIPAGSNDLAQQNDMDMAFHTY